MIRVSNVVEQVLLQDGFVIEAIQRGIFNSTAYAKEIHKAVEETTMKPVKLGTIIVALSRIAGTIKQQNFNPHIKINNFSITSLISEVTYERTIGSIDRFTTLSNLLASKEDFFTATEGLHEITIVCSEKARDAVINHFNMEPKIIINDLVGVSVRFSADYMQVPNTIYSLVGALAIRNINVIEIISTYTELTFIVYKNEMEKTIQALQKYAQR